MQSAISNLVNAIDFLISLMIVFLPSLILLLINAAIYDFIFVVLWNHWAIVLVPIVKHATASNMFLPSIVAGATKPIINITDPTEKKS